MSKQYTMTEGMGVAKIAARAIEAWLWTRPETVDVHNVEDDPKYQAADVDLLWVTERQCYQVEVKGDRLGHKTGNFFFETHSNKEKGTPGCFLYTEADLLFYYFVQTGVLHILPMPDTRDWFTPLQEQFQERETHTPVGADHYTTVGRLVPVNAVLTGVAGIWHGDI